MAWREWLRESEVVQRSRGFSLSRAMAARMCSFTSRRRRAGLGGLAEGQKVQYELKTDKMRQGKRGKSRAGLRLRSSRFTDVLKRLMDPFNPVGWAGLHFRAMRAWPPGPSGDRRCRPLPASEDASFRQRRRFSGISFKNRWFLLSVALAGRRFWHGPADLRPPVGGAGSFMRLPRSQ
jgi:hypothetical protein